MTKKPGRNRNGIFAALDVGSSKVCCFIAKREAGERGLRVTGIGQQVSRGVKNGAVIDMEAAQRSISAAVQAADPDAPYRGARSIDDDIWQLERAQRYRMAAFDMHKPVIAQVHGHCKAGGTDLALLCDMVIIAEDAEVGFPAGRDLGSLPNQLWLHNVGPQWTKRLLLTGDSVTGSEAAQIGFAMKAVPAEALEAEVEGLADRLTLVDPDILAANKRVVNMGMELMGARTLQRYATENDARGHQAASARAFVKRAGEAGLKQALKDRDAPFGDGRARVNGPERRDGQGRLTEND